MKTFNFDKEYCKKLYIDNRIAIKEFEETHPGISWKVFIRNVKNHGLPMRAKFNQKFYFTKEECERIYLIERWSREKFESAYPEISWEAFLYKVRGSYKIPVRIKYTTNDDLILSNLTEEEIDIIIGSLLGDGTIIKNNDTCYFRMTHGTKQLQYLEWKRNKLSRIILQQKPIYQKHKFGNTYLYIANAIRELRTWEKDWYISYDKSINKRTKIVPINYLEQMSSLGLAIWYMDDGCYSSNNNIVISTNAFSSKDLDTLRLYLKEKWDLHATIRKSGEIAFGVVETKKLIKIVNQHIKQIPCMWYKLGISNESVETIRKAPEKDEDIVRSA